MEKQRTGRLTVEAKQLERPGTLSAGPHPVLAKLNGCDGRLCSFQEIQMGRDYPGRSETVSRQNELPADRGSDRSEIKHRIGDHRMDELFEEIRRYIAEASEAWETKIKCVNI